VELRVSVAEDIRIEAEDGEAAGTAGISHPGLPRGRSEVSSGR
jgi:hypothetical protein